MLTVETMTRAVTAALSERLEREWDWAWRIRRGRARGVIVVDSSAVVAMMLGEPEAGPWQFASHRRRGADA